MSAKILFSISKFQFFPKLLCSTQIMDTYIHMKLNANPTQLVVFLRYVLWFAYINLLMVGLGAKL